MIKAHGLKLILVFVFCIVGPAFPSGMVPGTQFWNIGWEGWQDFFISGVDWNTTTNPWNPTLISELQQAKIKTLRFCDWNNCNSPQTCISEWNQRIPKTANHYNTENKLPAFVDKYDGATNTHTLIWNGQTTNGVAVEWQIDLCNRVGADLWLNIPAAASADYCYQLATLVSSQLKPDLKVYLEWANEVWNWGYPSTVYARNKADSLGLSPLDVGAFCDPWRKYCVYASVRIFQQFERVFGVNSPRLVKVICGQIGYHWPGYDYNHMIKGDLACLRNTTINPNTVTINAWAGAPYIGGQNIATQRNNIDTVAQWMQWAHNSLAGTGIKLICYEGGADNYPDNNLALTRDSAQEQIYVSYLTALAPYCEGTFNQYCMYGGCWGLKHAPGEAAANCPKWRGWLDFWSTVRLQAAPVFPFYDGLDLRVFQNPATDGQVVISLRSTGDYPLVPIKIFDIAGREIYQACLPVIANTYNTMRVDRKVFSTGFYVISAQCGGQVRSCKIFIP